MMNMVPLFHAEVGCHVNSQTTPTPILTERGVPEKEEQGEKTFSTEVGVSDVPFA